MANYFNNAINSQTAPWYDARLEKQKLDMLDAQKARIEKMKAIARNPAARELAASMLVAAMSNRVVNDAELANIIEVVDALHNSE